MRMAAARVSDRRARSASPCETINIYKYYKNIKLLLYIIINSFGQGLGQEGPRRLALRDNKHL